MAVVPRGFGAMPGGATRGRVRRRRRPAGRAVDPRRAQPRERRRRDRRGARDRAPRRGDRRGAAHLPGVEHRIEEVAVGDGVRYVNDSKATNVAAALRALASFPGPAST